MLDSPSRSSTFEDRPRLRQYDSAIAEYLKDLTSANTTRLFQHRLETFIKWAEEVEHEEDREVLRVPIEVSDVIKYARALDDRGLSYATVRAYVSAIGTIHNILEKYNPTADAKVRSVLAVFRAKQIAKQRRTYTFSRNAIGDILNNLQRPRKLRHGTETLEMTRQRAAVDKAMLLTMLQAGMRRSEAAKLTWEDVLEQPDGSGRLLLRTKRSSEGKTWVPITESCLRTLLAIKPEIMDDDSRVFNMSDSQINRRIKKMCEEASIDPETVSAHTLRASLAKLMLEMGAPVWMIEQHLRHEPPLLMYADKLRESETLRWLEQAIQPTA